MQGLHKLYEIAVEILRIGPAALAGVRPELNAVAAKSIEERSPFARTLVCTMVNGGAKYMADACSYDRITYEAMNSPFGRGAAEQLAQKAAEMLKHIFEQTVLERRDA